jgi:hypothetical protein
VPTRSARNRTPRSSQRRHPHQSDDHLEPRDHHLRAPAQVWPWLVQMGYGRAGFDVPDFRAYWRVRIVDPALVLVYWNVPTAS